MKFQFESIFKQAITKFSELFLHLIQLFFIGHKLDSEHFVQK